LDKYRIGDSLPLDGEMSSAQKHSRVSTSGLTAVGAAAGSATINQPGIAVQLLTAGSAACVADLITFPLDTAKVRLQVQGETSVAGTTLAKDVPKQGVIRTVKGIVTQEGPKALYNGIVPGLQRQMCFSAVRIGAYETVKQFYASKAKVDSGYQMFLIRIAAGITTGTLAILSAQPTDVVKVRMQAEQKLIGEPSRYKGVMDAYLTIGKTEGFKGLYKGTMPNIARNCIINIGEIVVYDVCKEALVKNKVMADGIPCHFTAAVAAGFCATLVASPVDVVKTRFMNSPEGRYRGALSCAMETARNEGFFAFYKGFNASFSRLVAWNICLWITYEQFKKGVLTLYN